MLYPLFFLESGVCKSMTPARDPAMAAATALGESKVFGPAVKYKACLSFYSIVVYLVHVFVQLV